MSTQTTKSPFPQWPQPIHDAHGDYRVEAALFESKLHNPSNNNKNHLYQHQTKVPHLPIPSVSETLAKLPSTVLPLAETPDEKSKFLQAVQDFPKQVSNLNLHERLETRRNVEFSDSSWLQNWWNTWAYLSVRDPVPINVSYFYHFQRDPTLPVASSSDIDLSIPRGACFLYKLAQLRKEICAATLPPPSIGKKNPIFLCNAQYKYMFHSCRIPKLEQDFVRMYDPSLAKHSHCIVGYKGRFFAVDFANKETGDPLPLDILEKRLRRVKDLVHEQQADKVELGWLTSWDRDSWAKGRDLLISVGGTDMENAFATLESGAFMLCLDDEKPVSRNECALQFLHGNTTSGYNRWYDKSMQYIVTPNGQAGMNGEHSMMDGMPTTHIAGIVGGAKYQDIALEQQETLNGNIDIDIDIDSGVHDIFAKCYDILASNSNVQNTIQKAKSDYYTLTTKHALQTKTFYGYGGNFIKSASCSPDAYVQMAMQLATYRLFEKQVGTYEATQTRVFLHGRTEVTRGVSLESEAFVKAMGLYSHVKSKKEKEIEISEKAALLRKAVANHSKYTGQAAQGQGVDRHLLGLAMLVKEGEPTPDLFNDAVFKRSKYWRVSTSHLTHPHFVNWGYGEVVPDGVGLSYSIQKDYCTFCITALKEHGWTEKLGDLLEDALIEMKSVIDMDGGKNSVVSRSKL